MTNDLRLSVSKAKTFLQCKKQFEFNYILKLPKKQRDYHTFGKFCHGVLELFHKQYIDGCLLPYNITMTDAFKTNWEEYKENMTPEMKKECWDIINQYLKIITNDKKNGKQFNVLSVEKRFELPLTENIMLNGAIDLIKLDDDNILHVADYKTSKNKKYLKDDWFQLMTYGLVLLKDQPDLKKIRASYIMLRHNFEYITKEFSVKELLATEKKILNYAEQINSEKEFAPNPSVLCGWCDFLGSCEEGQKQTNTFNGEVNW